VASPVLIGPDSESAQWVNDVAAALDAPCLVATKERMGDRQVRVDLPGIEQWAGRTPVVLDDIISSGHTMLETLRGLRERGTQAPVCIGVHGIFAEDAREQLLAAGAAQVVTSNSIGGHTALIDISTTVADVLGLLSTGCVDRDATPAPVRCEPPSRAPVRG
jgi:ribose-phosphate pyrophosphokinase